MAEAPSRNFLPTPGTPYGFVARYIMMTGGEDYLIEVDYQDQDNTNQRRILSKGTWLMDSIQINGWRGFNELGEALETSVTSLNSAGGFQLTVLY